MLNVEITTEFKRDISFQKATENESYEGVVTTACENISCSFYESASNTEFVITGTTKEELEEKTFDLVNEIERLSINRIISVNDDDSLSINGFSFSDSCSVSNRVGETMLEFIEDVDGNEIEVVAFFDRVSKKSLSKMEQEDLAIFLEDNPLNPYAEKLDIEEKIYGDIVILTKEDASKYFKID